MRKDIFLAVFDRISYSSRAWKYSYWIFL